MKTCEMEIDCMVVHVTALYIVLKARIKILSNHFISLLNCDIISPFYYESWRENSKTLLFCAEKYSGNIAGKFFCFNEKTTLSSCINCFNWVILYDLRQCILLIHHLHQIYSSLNSRFPRCCCHNKPCFKSCHTHVSAQMCKVAYLHQGMSGNWNLKERWATVKVSKYQER